MLYSQRRTGHYGVVAIATWAAWFCAAQGQLLTKKEERKGREKKGKEKERKGKRGKKQRNINIAYY